MHAQPNRSLGTNDVWRILRLYVLDYSDTLGPDLSQQLLGRIRARQVGPLCELCETEALKYYSLSTFRVLRQVRALISKNESLSDDAVCRSSAITSFMRNETVCRITNRRLAWFAQRPERNPWQSHIQRMQEVIGGILGDAKGWLDQIPKLVKVSSGATADLPKRQSMPYLKLRRRIPCTLKARPFVTTLASMLGYEVECQIRTANRITFVPKNYKTHRTIACEPTGNLPFQLAFDTYVKGALRPFGIDLKNGQALHQRLAQQASIDGLNCTVDFENCSDTVSLAAVGLLLPPDWYQLLDALRCPQFSADFGSGWYAKFSSMGNGTTFGLETLILYAAAIAVGAKAPKVYGDDVILSAALLEEYTGLTRFLGFRVNRAKTFSSGPFRESCGGDYYNGVNVTPVYVRRTPDVKDAAPSCSPFLPELAHYVNLLLSISYPGGQLWNYASAIVREHRLPLVPYQESTRTGVHIPESTARKHGLIRRVDGIDHFKGLQSVALERSCSKSYKALTLWHLRANTGAGDGVRELCTSMLASDVVQITKSVMQWCKPFITEPLHLSLVASEFRL